MKNRYENNKFTSTHEETPRRRLSSRPSVNNSNSLNERPHSYYNSTYKTRNKYNNQSLRLRFSETDKSNAAVLIFGLEPGEQTVWNMLSMCGVLSQSVSRIDPSLKKV